MSHLRMRRLPRRLPTMRGQSKRNQPHRRRRLRRLRRGADLLAVRREGERGVLVLGHRPAEGGTLSSVRVALGGGLRHPRRRRRRHRSRSLRTRRRPRRPLPPEGLRTPRPPRLPPLHLPRILRGRRRLQFPTRRKSLPHGPARTTIGRTRRLFGKRLPRHRCLSHVSRIFGVRGPRRKDIGTTTRIGRRRRRRRQNRRRRRNGMVLHALRPGSLRLHHPNLRPFHARQRSKLLRILPTLHGPPRRMPLRLRQGGGIVRTPRGTDEGQRHLFRQGEHPPIAQFQLHSGVDDHDGERRHLLRASRIVGDGGVVGVGGGDLYLDGVYEQGGGGNDESCSCVEWEFWENRQHSQWRFRMPRQRRRPMVHPSGHQPTQPLLPRRQSSRRRPITRHERMRRYGSPPPNLHDGWNLPQLQVLGSRSGSNGESDGVSRRVGGRDRCRYDHGSHRGGGECVCHGIGGVRHDRRDVRDGSNGTRRYHYGVGDDDGIDYHCRSDDCVCIGNWHNRWNYHDGSRDDHRCGNHDDGTGGRNHIDVDIDGHRHSTNYHHHHRNRGCDIHNSPRSIHFQYCSNDHHEHCNIHHNFFSRSHSSATSLRRRCQPPAHETAHTESLSRNRRSPLGSPCGQFVRRGQTRPSVWRISIFGLAVCSLSFQSSWTRCGIGIRRGISGAFRTGKCYHYDHYHGYNCYDY
mmetsp:Transcript_8297/g.17658  ORF Transcript_8297/g.17658 Transcript_8297/m.17658 type:complete len:687 (-) Transcript_8297:2580-4640(-)